MIRVTQWDWTEAFNKFGFEDGDGWNGTHLIVDFLKEEFNYDCEVDSWGMHNYMIFNVYDKSKKSIIKKEATIGYDNPEDYLPKKIVNALEEEFPYFDYDECEIENQLNDK